MSGGPPAGEFRFPIAGPADDAAVRRLLRENPMPGALALTLEREPSSFIGAALEGDVHDTVLCVAPDGRVVGLGSRAVRDGFINGEPARVGYLGQLRLDPAYRFRRRLIERAFAVLHERHRATGGARVYATTIIEDNRVARRLLGSGRLRIPTYREREAFCTLALPLRRPPRLGPSPGTLVRAAAASDLPAISACLLRNYARYQLAPRWTVEELTHPERTRGLRPEDFFVALRGGEVVACLALWDQQRFKQSVVRGYSGTLRWTRHLVNAAAPLLDLPALPPAGSTLRCAFLSHLAADGDDGGLLCPLVAKALARARGEGLDYVTLGLAGRNPLLGAVKRAFRHFEYRAVLYLVHWEDGTAGAEAIDGRVPHLEVAAI